MCARSHVLGFCECSLERTQCIVGNSQIPCAPAPKLWLQNFVRP